MYGRISFLSNTKRVGDRSEIRVIAALVEAGYTVMLPFTRRSRIFRSVLPRDGCSIRGARGGRTVSGIVAHRCDAESSEQEDPMG